LLRETQFVGTKTLALSIKFIQMGLKFKQIRMMIQPHLEKLLFSISLPLFVTGQKDLLAFQQDPVEYVRLQNDCQNDKNVKRQLSVFVEKICGLKFGKRKDKQQNIHLQNYLSTIG
jgi:hypothetical protein